MGYISSVSTLVRAMVPFFTSPSEVDGDTAFNYAKATQTLSVPKITTSSDVTAGGALVSTGNFSVLGSSTVTLPANSVAASALAANAIQYASVAVSNAELIALYTTAKTLVASPGSGKVLEFVRATITYDYGTAACTIGSATNLSIKYKDKTGADVSSTRAATGFLDGTADAYSMFQPLTAQLALDANAVAQPLCLALAGANVTDGTGCVLKVNIAYRVHTL